MKHLMRCLLLILIPAVTAYGEARPRPQLQWISLLRPAEGSDTREVVHQLWWSDGTEEIVVSPRPGTQPRTGKTEYSFDLATGTYTFRHTPPARGERTKMAANAGYTFEVCDPMVEESCTPSSGATATGQIATAYTRDDHGGAVAQLGVMPCIGDQDGIARVDFASADCAPKGLSLTGCLQRAPAPGTFFSDPSILVQAVFGPTGGTQCSQRIELLDDGRGNIMPRFSTHAGVQAVVERGTYSAPPCGRELRNTGGEDTDPPDDPDYPNDPDDPEDPGDGEEDPGSGEAVCVPVYDGNTGAYLGTCCGTTTEKIIKCAMEIS